MYKCVYDVVDASLLSQISQEDVFNSSQRSFRTKCTELCVTEFITRHVMTAYIKSETAQEIQYILPFDEAKKGGFEKLFAALDRSLDQLHISSYGVIDTTLEEVFLKVTEKALNAEQGQYHLVHVQFSTTSDLGPDMSHDANVIYQMTFSCTQRILHSHDIIIVWKIP